MSRKSRIFVARLTRSDAAHRMINAFLLSFLLSTPILRWLSLNVCSTQRALMCLIIFFKTSFDYRRVTLYAQCATVGKYPNPFSTDEIHV